MVAGGSRVNRLVQGRCVALVVAALLLAGCEATDTPALWLADDARLWQDTSAIGTAESVRAGRHDEAFQAVTTREPSLGTPEGVVWLQIDHALPPACGPCLLELGSPTVDRIDVWRIGDRTAPAWTLGDWVPKAQQPVRAPDLVVPVTGADMPLLLRVETASPTTLSLRALPANVWWAASARRELVYGLYYGLMAALLLYNLFLFVAIRNVAYLYYCLWLGGFALFQFCWNGHLHAWVWPSHLTVPPYVSIGLLYLGIVGGLKFCEHISNAAVLAPRMHALLRALVGLTLAMVLLAPLHAPWAIQAAPLIGAITIGAIVHTLVLTGLRGYRPAVFTLAGFAALAPGGVALALSTAGLIDGGWMARHGMTLGSALDALILSFALADRINLLNADKQRLQQNLIDAQQQYAKDLLGAQDSERARLARELHDGIAQQLAAVAGRLRRLARAPDAAPPQRLAEAATWAGDAVDDVRRISHHLHPQQLERLGLAAAIRADAAHAADTAGLQLHVDDSGFDPSRLDAHATLQSYRIAQEAIHNAVRHADASELTIELRSEPSAAHLTVTDNGSGLSGNQGAGLGLRSMQERAASTGGRIRIGNGPAGGVRVHLTVPHTA